MLNQAKEDRNYNVLALNGEAQAQAQKSGTADSRNAGTL